MSNDELKELIDTLETELHSLAVATNDAALEGDDDTADLVHHAGISLDAAIKHLKRFHRRRSKF